MFEGPKYVISLAERSDRRRDFIISAAKAGIKDYKFYPAIRGTGKHGARAGCRRSHKRLIEFAADNKYPYIIIIEDDAVFDPQILSKISGVPDDWDMLYFGAHNHKPLNMITQNIGKCTFSLSTVCYAVRNTVYNLITASLDQDLPIDMIYATQVQSMVKAYCFSPNLVSQAPGLSDIENKVKDYSKYYI